MDTNAEIHFPTAELSLFFCLCGQQGLCFIQKAKGVDMVPAPRVICTGSGLEGLCVCVFCMYAHVCIYVAYMLCGVCCGGHMCVCVCVCVIWCEGYSVQPLSS